MSITELLSCSDFYGVTTHKEASGSGIIVGMSDDELLILTSYHLNEGCEELTVQFSVDH